MRIENSLSSETSPYFTLSSLQFKSRKRERIEGNCWFCAGKEKSQHILIWMPCGIKVGVHDHVRDDEINLEWKIGLEKQSCSRIADSGVSSNIINSPEQIEITYNTEYYSLKN